MEQHLLIIIYEDCNVTIKTSEPEKEIEAAFRKGNVLSIVKDNEIIYTKNAF